MLPSNVCGGMISYEEEKWKIEGRKKKLHPPYSFARFGLQRIICPRLHLGDERCQTRPSRSFHSILTSITRNVGESLSFDLIIFASKP